MQIIHSTQLSLPINQRLVVTMGVYDGVHAGHQHILQHLREYAVQNDAKTLLLTFYPHPRKILYPEQNIFLLNTLEERLERLLTQNLDYLWVYPFDKTFSNLTAHEFVEKIIVEQLHAHTVFVGYDHKFGKNREGGYEVFKELGKKYDFDVIEIPAYQIDEVNISSTKIRKALAEGDINTANMFLNYPYMLTGKVVQGKQTGRKLGFPTANMQLYSAEKLIPKTGVYVSKINLSGQLYYGITNIGYRPTIQNTSDLHIETHIFNFDHDIYGQAIQIYPLVYIRQEQKFSSLEELSIQIEKDKQFALEYIRLFAHK
jgi:riboflavin kinase/FMN adenylyltransferase